MVLLKFLSQDSSPTYALKRLYVKWLQYVQKSLSMSYQTDALPSQKQNTTILQQQFFLCLTPNVSHALGAQIALSSSTLQRKTHKENKESISESKLFRRPRILALAGAKSNGTVTRLQLENLHITEEDYDIDYLRGQIETEEVYQASAGLVHGPFFSWINPEKEKLGRSLIEAVQRFLIAVHVHGPYDGIYSFSTGGIFASLAADMVRDTALQEAIAKLESSKACDVIFNFVRRISSISGVKATSNMRFDCVCQVSTKTYLILQNLIKKNNIQNCHPCVRRNQGIKFSLPPKANRPT